jgi:anti-anti-sigma regulatory factor
MAAFSARPSPDPSPAPTQEPTPGLRVETVHPDASTTWLVFHGEADLATRDTLHDHLDAAARLDAASVHLHLADLTFADSRAVLELTDFADDARRRGSTVVACDPTAVLRRLAGLLGVALILGVT